MKKVILLIICSIAIFTIKAQNLSIVKKTKIDLSGSGYFASFGNSVDNILYAGENKKGLNVYSLEAKTEIKITDASGAIQKAYFNIEGNLNYTEIEFEKGRRININKIYNLSIAKSVISKSNDIHDVEVQVSGKSIELVRKGTEKTTLKPLGDFYYLWVSLSPDESKILFTVAGKGTYVSNIDGDDIQELGYLNAPEWINNNWVTGMNDIDNGDIILSSDIMAINIYTKKKYNLTYEDISIALYPKVSGDGSKIVYHTIDGQVFILEIKTKN